MIFSNEKEQGGPQPAKERKKEILQDKGEDALSVKLQKKVKIQTVFFTVSGSWYQDPA